MPKYFKNKVCGYYLYYNIVLSGRMYACTRQRHTIKRSRVSKVLC